MEKVHVREANGEVLVFLDRNMGDRLHALEEAVRILQIEVIREKHGLNTNPDRQIDRHQL